jgi:hypothetical protein
MKKPLLLACFSCFVINATAQDLQWGLNIAPGISYRFAPTASVSDEAVSIQGGEETMYVFDFGLDLRQSISPRISFGTGVFYSQRGFSNTHLAAIYDDPSLSRRYLIDFVQDYLEVPFFLTYDLAQKDKLSFYALGGITNSLLLNSKNVVSATSGEVSEETMARLEDPYLENRAIHNFGTLAGFGVQTQVDDKTDLGLEILGKVMTTPLLDRVSNSRRYLCSGNVNFRFVRKIH